MPFAISINSSSQNRTSKTSHRPNSPLVSFHRKLAIPLHQRACIALSLSRATSPNTPARKVNVMGDREVIVVVIVVLYLQGTARHRKASRPVDAPPSPFNQPNQACRRGGVSSSNRSSRIVQARRSRATKLVW